MPHDVSRRQVLGGAVAGIVAAAGSGENPFAPKDPVLRVDTLMPKLRAQSRVPGVSIAVIKDHAIAFEKAYGLANVEGKTPMTPATIFQAASLTKPVFAYVVMKLIESGQIGLDTPLVEYIAHARISRDPRAHTITPRMVLAHMSGLPNWASDKRPMRVDFDPGAHFGYSGEAFNVLQEAVEKQTGRSLNALLTEMIAQPFGLNESVFVWMDAFESIAARGYEWDESPVESRSKPTEAMAASSLHTTARDYAKFMIASIANAGQNSNCLDYATMRMMLSPQIKLAGPLAWGLGWALHLANDGDTHWHFGDSRGYMSYAALQRSSGNGVVIFTNGRHGLRLCHAIARELLPSTDTIFQWIYDVFYEGELKQWPEA